MAGLVTAWRGTRSCWAEVALGTWLWPSEEKLLV